jgi:hypothetical protein
VNNSVYWRRESKRARGTDVLETAEGGIGQNRERKRPSKGHQRSGKSRKWNRSEQRKKQASEGHPLSGDKSGTEGKRANERQLTN